jgi:hypothetical protein
VRELVITARLDWDAGWRSQKTTKLGKLYSAVKSQNNVLTRYDSDAICLDRGRYSSVATIPRQLGHGVPGQGNFRWPLILYAFQEEGIIVPIKAKANPIGSEAPAQPGYS